MTVIIIGDVAAEESYHLGDEAMTESAIDALRARGAESLTVIAKAPEVARARFGTEALPRIGFEAMSWHGRNSRLDAVSRLAEGERGALPTEDPAHEVVEAFRGARALVIAGGGNISSSFANHLYERVALSRVARRLGIPVLITSQTFGPLFAPSDRELLEELLSSACAIGSREAYSHALVLDAGIPQGRAVHGLDDAAWLEPNTADLRRVDELDLPTRFAVASFTFHRGSMGITKDEYFSRIATTLDLIATELDVQVLLTPHLGSFAPASPTSDQVGNEEIVGHSRSGKLRALPQLMAREAIALTRRAQLSLSTRYHPTVFGPSNDVPIVSIATSYYSSVRMHGALSNVGLGDFVLPWEIWTPELVRDACLEFAERRDALRTHLDPVIESCRAQSNSWWDAIAETALQGREWSGVDSIPPAPRYEVQGGWVGPARVARPVADLHMRARAMEKQERDKLGRQVKRLEAELAQAKLDAERAMQRAETALAKLAEAKETIRERGTWRYSLKNLATATRGGARRVRRQLLRRAKPSR